MKFWRLEDGDEIALIPEDNIDLVLKNPKGLKVMLKSRPFLDAHNQVPHFTGKLVAKGPIEDFRGEGLTVFQSEKESK